VQKIIKRLPVLLIALLLYSHAAMAQIENDQSSLQSKIENLLAELPTEDEEEFRTRMNELASMGEKGLVKMTDMLSPPNEGDNSKLEYALGGFAYFVSHPAREDLRQMTVKAFCQALENVSNDENKAFLIRQFEMVGKNDAVPCLQVYLNDERFCAPVAKALINIGTPEASESLLKALRSSDGSCRLSMVQALGDLKFRKALKVINPLVNEEDPKLQKLSLYALANIADPASQNVLAKEAEKDDFTFGKENATAAYLLYAKRLVENGQQHQAENIAKSLLERNADHQVHTRTAALKLLTQIQGEESIQLLTDAAGSGRPEYRAAALKFAAEYITPASTEMWVKKSRESNPEVQAEIIRMLGQNNARDALPMVVEALGSSHDKVRIAAIGAVGMIGNENSISKLLEVLKKSTEEEVIAIKNALLILDANGLINKVADALPEMQPEAQAALVEVLGNRGASHRLNDVLSFVKNDKDVLRKSALSALDKLVTKEDLPKLFPLLKEKWNSEEVEMVQGAITSALRGYGDQSRKSAIVLEQMAGAQGEKKPLYFPILASIGGKEAENAVSEAFRSGDVDTKQAALTALASWSDESAMDELYRIGRENPNDDYQDEALKGYIRAIGQSEYPDEEKLTMLRKAMDVAETSDQKRRILREVGRGKTFPALVFAGKFLEEPDLQQQAASAVMDIALNNEMNGEVVRNLLNKTLEVMEGPGSEYQKPAISRYLADMPQGKD
jgi:HEAT repeat protein